MSTNLELYDGERIQSGSSCDLSLGGMGLMSDSILPIGSEVEMRFALGASELRTLGEVVRADNGHVGVRFVRLDQRALTTILAAVARA